MIGIHGAIAGGGSTVYTTRFLCYSYGNANYIEVLMKKIQFHIIALPGRSCTWFCTHTMPVFSKRFYMTLAGKRHWIRHEVCRNFFPRAGGKSFEFDLAAWGGIFFETLITKCAINVIFCVPLWMALWHERKPWHGHRQTISTQGFSQYLWSSQATSQFTIFFEIFS